LNATVQFDRSTVALRRRIVCLAAVRGLKPTATIVVSLRETGRKCPNSSPGVKTPGYYQDVPPGQRNVAHAFSTKKATRFTSDVFKANSRLLCPARKRWVTIPLYFFSSLFSSFFASSSFLTTTLSSAPVETLTVGRAACNCFTPASLTFVCQT
jgi:hypothetical protein